MTSWALLLLASALLATPGLTFSGLIPEGNDLMTADLCQEEQFLENLILEAVQEVIKHTASLMCEPMPLLRDACKKVITELFSKITKGIVNGKTPREICVKIRMCPPTIELEAM
ncbi:antimicrobial peptide NK-lysin-like [Crocuta crocuta]